MTLFSAPTPTLILLLTAHLVAISAFAVPKPSGGANFATSLFSAATTSAPSDAELFHRSLLEARLKYEGGGAGSAPSVAAAAEPPKAKKVRRGTTSRADGISVYVGNLSFDTTEDQLRDLFETHGTVTGITIPPDRETGKCRGFAFVTMPNRDEMQRACEAIDQSSFLGRTVYANESVPKKQQKKEMAESKIYVGNIAYETTKQDLVEYFGQFGDVTDVYIPTDRNTGDPRGFAFVNMSTEDTERAIEGTDNREFNGRTLSVSISLPRGQRAPRRQQTDNVKLYVGNLSFYSDVDAVRSLFEEYGTVHDCYMPLDRDTGRPRGFAFVTMEPDAAMRAADETDGYEMDGRILRVNEAQPKGYSSGSNYGYDDGANDGDWGDAGDDSWGNESY